MGKECGTASLHRSHFSLTLQAEAVQSLPKDIKVSEQLQQETSKEEFGLYTWLVYSLAYLLLCMCIALSHAGSKVQHPIAATPGADLIGSTSNRSGSIEEDNEEEDVKDLEHASLPPSTQAAQASSLPKTKKKKKSRGGLEEVLDKVADAVNTELGSAKTPTTSSKRKGGGGDKKE
ncbi:hypothetical protein BASA81_008803 [Batrachochytrium salamandrivorans]|nr:hypothetical protein BASA81_008803 [Batrachochytrium salamandrivorans]